MNPRGAVERLPRTRLAFLPTPLVELPHLSAGLGGPRIWMKRDDQTGLGLGGNKARKLEYLLGEAVARGCDVVVTGGATQSNHCRQTAAAAATLGIECHLALGGEEPDEIPTGNLLLDHLFGASIHWCGAQRKGEGLLPIVEQLRTRGRSPYVIPYGGSDPVGAMGFVAAVGELKTQIEERKLTLDAVVVASSSGGTQAGMVVGADLFGLDLRIVGVGIDKGEAGDGPYEAWLARLADEIAARIGLRSTYQPDRFEVRREYFGLGYGVVGNLEREAIAVTARTEGVLLDPVYTGRAMGGLFDLIRRGEFASNETVLFWHTGGAPALFAYADDLASPSRRT